MREPYLALNEQAKEMSRGKYFESDSYRLMFSKDTY